MSAKQDECFILIKALPHRSSKYFETVCCAGVGRDQRWRRQYPVPFRILNDVQKFARWQWITYRYVAPEDDRRSESQKVLPESIVAGSLLKESERANFLRPLLRSSFDEANERRESLTLIRPRELTLIAKDKSASDLASETQKHKELADQLSLFDPTAQPLEPCPVSFTLQWVDQDGKRRNHECDDWETSTAYSRFQRSYGSQEAVQILQGKYESYLAKGLALAFSTHSRRNIEFGSVNQWLLVGLIRLDATEQIGLPL